MKTTEQIQSAIENLKKSQELMSKLAANVGIREPDLIVVAAAATIKALEWVNGDDPAFDKLLGSLKRTHKSAEEIFAVEQLLKKEPNADN